jgi:hypothetical protein
MSEDKHTKYASPHINFQCSDSQREQKDPGNHGEKRREEEEKNSLYNIYNIKKEKKEEDVKVLRSVYVSLLLWLSAKKFASHSECSLSHLVEKSVQEYIENHAAELPLNVQLNIVHQVQAKPDSVMLDLEVDLAREELLSVVNRVKKLRPTAEWNDPTKKRYLLDRLRKLLPKVIQLAKRSENEEFQNLVVEARELLRGASC